MQNNRLSAPGSTHRGAAHPGKRPTDRDAHPADLRQATLPADAGKAKGDCSKYRAERHSSLTVHKLATPSAPAVTAT